MHASLQTWFPFRIQVCLNSALLATISRAEFTRNGFPWVEDFAAAQQLLNQQVQTCWLPPLQSIA